jgi:hypothetical protein
MIIFLIYMAKFARTVEERGGGGGSLKGFSNLQNSTFGELIFLGVAGDAIIL